MGFPAVIILFSLGIFFIDGLVQPKRSGEIELKGIRHKVEVTRDEYGIPHIKATNQEDAMLALGYTVASERLFQIDILRRISNGELSEVFGSSMLKHDVLLRKLRLRKTMEENWKRNYAQFDPQMIAQINSFVMGVNQYIDHIKVLPWEFQILGYSPEKFTHIETMAISGYMALSFAEGLVADTLFTDLNANFPTDKVNELMVRIQKTSLMFWYDVCLYYN